MGNTINKCDAHRIAYLGDVCPQCADNVPAKSNKGRKDTGKTYTVRLTGVKKVSTYGNPA